MDGGVRGGGGGGATVNAALPKHPRCRQHPTPQTPGRQVKQGWAQLHTCSAASTASAISTATSSCASLVLAPRCGVTITSGRPTSGLSAGGGSTSKTSRAAPATAPESSAAARAASSMTPPRATLTMRAPFLICRGCGVWVDGERGGVGVWCGVVWSGYVGLASSACCVCVALVAQVSVAQLGKS